jgi:hypothetical protein
MTVLAVTLPEDNSIVHLIPALIWLESGYARTMNNREKRERRIRDE